MPIRLDPASLNGACVYIVRSAADGSWSQLHVYDGGIGPVVFAALVMTSARAEAWDWPGIEGTCLLRWEGCPSRLGDFMGPHVNYACANCGVRVEHLKKCCNCHFMRYCSTACSLGDWKHHHCRVSCRAMRAVYDRHVVRSGKYKLVYGLVSRYEVAVWEHIIGQRAMVFDCQFEH